MTSRWSTVSTLWFDWSLESRRQGTSHRPRNRPKSIVTLSLSAEKSHYFIEIEDQIQFADIVKESNEWRTTSFPSSSSWSLTRSRLRQSCGLLRDKLNCYRWRPHKCKSISPHSDDRRFCSYGTENIEDLSRFILTVVLTSTKLKRTDQFSFIVKNGTYFVCLASRTVTKEWTSSINFCFSSSWKFINHLARRVLPARFWIRMKRIILEVEGKERKHDDSELGRSMYDSCDCAKWSVV